MARLDPSLLVFILSNVIVVLLALSVSSAADFRLTEKAPAIFIFGDSSVDAGNNNYIETTAENQANYPPYGQNGYFKHPTGRFSDGRIIVDFIAEYAKLPSIPPFLEPSAEFDNGANFASGGAGVLPETNQGQVIDLQKQLKYFEEVERSLTEKMGDASAKELISEAVYFISIGSNDYMGGYLGNPKMRESFPPNDYIGMVIGNLTQAIQVLYDKGGRKFGFLSLSPLGCLPALRALNSNAGTNKEESSCFKEASALAFAHNNALSAVLASLAHALPGFNYCNSKFYDWFHDRIHHPQNYGFKEGVNACCGTGPYGGIFSCGGKNAVSEYKLCDDAKDHVWWDSIHPTEGIHEQCAKSMWNGSTPSVGPYNLQTLFFGSHYLTIADIVDDPRNLAS